MDGFDKIPPGALHPPEPFHLHVPAEDVDGLEALLSLSRLGPETWENTHRGFGLSREWLAGAKEAWLHGFDWRGHERRINSFPNFAASVRDPVAGGGAFRIHFAALFSARPDAVPIIFMHGWPGSFLEFLPMLELVAKKYTHEDLPYHIIVPSLPGYTLSSGPPKDRDFTVDDSARIMHQLMVDLGFGERGYVAQGGDVGSGLACRMMLTRDECKAIHLNLIMLGQDDFQDSMDDLTEREVAIVQKQRQFWSTGSAYAVEHGTRPATIGLVLSSSPLALLAWIGEKMIDWADEREPIELDTILAMVSLYWFTDTFPRSIYPYRSFTRGERPSWSGLSGKPFGYSVFPSEIITVPEAWAKRIHPNMIRYDHDKGGHFGALEQPEAFLQDIEDFAQRVGDLFSR